MTDFVKPAVEAMTSEPNVMLSPDLDDVSVHIQDLRAAVMEAITEARLAAVRSEQVEKDYQRVLGNTSLEERLASFESFLVLKVKEELHAQHSPTQQLLHNESVGPALVMSTGTSESVPRDRTTRYAQAQQRVASEALRAKTAALEQRQSVLEGKLNALVSDLVLTNQTNHNEMKTFGDHLRLQLKRHKEEVRQKMERGEPLMTDAGTVAAPLVEARMGEMIKVMGLLDARTKDTQSSLDAAEEQWFALMARLVEKLGEVTERVGQLEGLEMARTATEPGGSLGAPHPALITPALQAHLRTVEQAMCHFADDLDSLRSEVHRRTTVQPHSLDVSGKALNGGNTLAITSVSRCPGVQGMAVAQLLAAQQHRLTRTRFFQTWKRAVEEKRKRERDEMILSVLRAHQEEIQQLKERVDESVKAAPKKVGGGKREQPALLKELQKCIRVAVADKGNPPSTHMTRALQALGNWAEQTDHSLRANAL